MGVRCNGGVTNFDVPILTQSEDWALFYDFGNIGITKVPILTQSEDWAL